MDGISTYPNLIDLFMAIIIAVVIHSGARKGISTEIFKLFGMFCAIFVALHYYARFADVLRVQFFGKDASTELTAIIILSVLIVVIFLLISRGWSLILKYEFHQKVDWYGGIIIALARSYFVCGLVFFILLLSNHKYISSEAWRSVSRITFRYVAVDFYKTTYTLLISKMFPGEKVNKEAYAVVFQKKKKKN